MYGEDDNSCETGRRLEVTSQEAGVSGLNYLFHSRGRGSNPCSTGMTMLAHRYITGVPQRQGSKGKQKLRGLEYNDWKRRADQIRFN